MQVNAAVTSACLVELIDTLWNVNYFSTISLNSFCGELIDTLWNVNALIFATT